MKEKNGEHPFGDAGQIILLCMFMIVWVADSFIYRKSTFISDHIPIYIRLFILAISFIIAFYLFMSGHVVVSHDQRPTGIVSTGAFRYVRHPLYMGAILFYLGLAFSTASLFSLALLVLILLFYNYIASYEEMLLDKRYRENYSTYKKKTNKWIPKIKSLT